MAKKESTLKNMLIALFLVTFISSTLLGIVYKYTKGPIEAALLAKKNAAIQQVTPAFDNHPNDEMYKFPADGDTLYLYPVRMGDSLVGTAVETFSKKGFGGLIRIMVGFKPDGTILNYQVLEHKETPGLGTKMDIWFKTDKGNQSVIGKNPGKNKLTVSKDGGEVDAITAATISSRAFCDAVSRAYNAYMKGGKK